MSATLFIKPQKHNDYPIFSYSEVYDILDVFEMMIEQVACAKDPQAMFNYSKISVDDVLDIHNILYLELADVAIEKIKHIREAEKNVLLKSPGKSVKDKRFAYANNPFIWDVLTSHKKDDVLKAFKMANEAKGRSREENKQKHRKSAEEGDKE